jgi:hypothetical protein
MPSRRERGEYGSANKVVNWDKYNPWGLKVRPFLEEKVCGLCQSKADVIFPMSPHLCEKCASKAVGRKDVLAIWKRKFDLSGYRCDLCGAVTYFPIILNTRVCHRCTNDLGAQTRKNMAHPMARRIVP